MTNTILENYLARHCSGYWKGVAEDMAAVLSAMACPTCLTPYGYTGQAPAPHSNFNYLDCNACKAARAALAKARGE